MANMTRRQVRRRIHARVRRKVSGTPERPRLSVYRSLKHIYAQVVDDVNGRTLAAASSLETELPQDGAKGGNVAGAARVGSAIAGRLRSAGLQQVVFDRGGCLYHGRVKALADAVREGGVRC